MANLHRIQWLHRMLLESKYPNCRNVAEYFEISRRQAMRDIEYLKYSLNAPVEYSPKHRGYYYTEADFTLPGFFLGRDEKQRLGYLAQQYMRIPSNATRELSKLFSKITGEGVGEKPYKPLTYSDYEDLISKAAAYQKKITVVYNKQGEKNKRIVHPYKILLRNGRSYLFAFCEKRRDFRTFRIDRIETLSVLPQEYTFHPDFKAYYDLIRLFPAFHQKYTARIWFAYKPRISRFISPVWDKEHNILSFEFLSSETFVVKLLNLDLPYKILSPNWLKVKLKKRMKYFLENL